MRCRARLALALAVLVLGGACASAPPQRTANGDSVAVGVPVEACVPPRTWQGDGLPERFPERLRLPEAAVVTDVVEVQAGVVLDGYVGRPVPSVLDEFRRALDAADLAVEREDDEGREAELWFTDGQRQGQVLISKTRCPEGATGFRVIAGFSLDVEPGSGAGAAVLDGESPG